MAVPLRELVAYAHRGEITGALYTELFSNPVSVMKESLSAFIASLSPEDREKFRSSAQAVRPNLWIGGQVSAWSPTELKRLGISYVVAANGSPPRWFAFNNDDFPEVLVLDLDDDADAESAAAISNLIPRAIAWISRALKDSEGNENNEKVLIFCTAGRSRSASILCAYLMWAEGLGFRDALLEVRKARPWVQPNEAFVRVLLRFESTLLKDGTVCFSFFQTFTSLRTQKKKENLSLVPYSIECSCRKRPEQKQILKLLAHRTPHKQV